MLRKKLCQDTNVLISNGESEDPVSVPGELVNEALEPEVFPCRLAVILSADAGPGVVTIQFFTSGGTGSYSFPAQKVYVAGSLTKQLDFGRFELNEGLVLNCQVLAQPGSEGKYCATLVVESE